MSPLLVNKSNISIVYAFVLTFAFFSAGVTSIGVLVWAVAPDSEASLYKTLVANTE